MNKLTRNEKHGIPFWGSISSILGLALGLLSIFLTNYKIASIIVLAISLILFMYFSFRLIKQNIFNVVIKALGHYDELKESYINSFWFGKKSEIDFLNKIDFNKVDSIEIVGHTGENLIKNFLKTLGNYDLEIIRKIPIRILLKNPRFEFDERRNGILNILRKVHKSKIFDGLNIGLHFYHHLPTFRSIIYSENINGNIKRFAYLSYYHFPGPFSKNWPFAIEIAEDDKIRHPFIDKRLSWFNHLWGKDIIREREIHTILFDFDDTLVNSHQIQIDAWVELIREAKNTFNVNIDQFKDAFKAKLSSKLSIQREVAKLFFLKQSADLMFGEIFTNLEQEQERKLKKRRFEIRKNKFEASPDLFFPGSKEVIVELSNYYNLVIISATDEDMIKKHMKNVSIVEAGVEKSIISFFRYVIGKNEPMLGWSSLKRKSQIILKAINILGVPPSRLIYVGDNNGDFLASTTIGIEFVEARLFSTKLKKLLNKESLIFSNEKRHKMTDWHEFHKIIEIIEEDKKDEKYVRLPLTTAMR